MRVDENTWLRAGQHLDHAIAFLGHIPLEEFDGQHLDELYEYKLDLWLASFERTGVHLRTHQLRREGTKVLGGLAPQTIFNMHRVLFTALRAASRGKHRRLLHNPAEEAEPPAVPPRDLCFLDVEQGRRLLVEADRHEEYGSLITVALQVGARSGELLARTWADYDDEAGTLHIWNARKRSGMVGRTKTSASRRTVCLPERSRVALARRRQRLMEAGSFAPGDYIWASETGGMLDPAWCLNSLLHPMLARASLDKMRFHDLRHTAATLLLRRMKAH